ncbi:transcription factor bHLH118-like [Vigna umbellata]|uniref:transcription factor bHLH118-like n=1 Tax=Vigna umbellata TaxID=87088 RepID=UPI001F5F1384|nr:transcription factor bHLH118-like [Vigna umbellata]XP_047160930.1 transcription factor bHLH118-like [Vigna umbellata]
MDENKKWMHKETERQRRQEMGKLCNNLRSLLPLEYIKGKRSTSDHVHEAMNYINHLQDKVKQLQEKRDALLKVSNNLSSIENESSSATHLPPLVLVHPFPGGLEIICSHSFRKSAFPMSRLLDILHKEGLNVVTTTSIRRDGRFIHTIQSEDPNHSNMVDTDYSELQIKITEALSSSSLQETLPEPENC